MPQPTAGPLERDRRAGPGGLETRLRDPDGAQTLRHRHDVGLVAQDGVAELLVLRAQRLRLLDRVTDDVALRDTPELRDRVPGLADLTVGVPAEVGGEGVRHEGALLTGDDRDPLLERREPVD